MGPEIASPDHPLRVPTRWIPSSTAIRRAAIADDTRSRTRTSDLDCTMPGSAAPASGRVIRPAAARLKRRVWCAMLCGATLAGSAATLEAQRPASAPLRIGVVLDGPSAETDEARITFEREIAGFFSGTAAVEFTPAHRATGAWTVPSVNAAIDRLLADSTVELVLALGPMGSNELAHRRALPKPAIAALIADAALQGLPFNGQASGVTNLSYVDIAVTTSRTLEAFHQVVPYRHLAVLVHPGLLATIPDYPAWLRQQGTTLRAEVTVVPVTESAAEALRAIPAEADAAYVGALDQMSRAGVDSLISGLLARRLPSFAAAGRPMVERGMLVSYAAPDDLVRRARRVAGTIRRIRSGEDAGTLPVSLASVARLTLNLATARAIGLSPGWTTLIEADLLHEESPSSGPEWSLAGVGREASRVNLDLRAADQAVASGAQNVRLSRAPLLPQIQADATGTAIRSETAAASMGQHAQRETAASVSFSQALYDDQAWTNHRVARDAQRGRVADQQRTRLDVVLDATIAYLNLLRTKAVARVERENVALTRSNLDVAYLRERTGAGGLADVYRWQAELAQSRRRVLDADAQVALASLELNRMLDRPLEESFRIADAGIDDPALLISEPKLLVYLGNPASFARFRDFTVQEGIAVSPELQAVDARIQAEKAKGAGASRSFYLPTVTLEGGLSSVLSRGGAGSGAPALGGFTLSRPPDETWSLRLRASIPLFTGFARQARVSEARSEVQRLTLVRQATAQRVGQQIRSALQLASASWANITQAREAATAASKNLDLTTDAYGRGAVNIISLLDAQQAALEANEAAANAVYAFLIDLMKVQRAIGQFDFFLTDAEREAYFRRLDAWFRANPATERQ
ncbi:MAG: TolC family protein [Gemmatimonadales bacterium]